MKPYIAAGAVVSECGQFRYRLWRYWDNRVEPLVFVMLNPSTADAQQDDPTIRKCMGFAERLSFGGIEVVNLFAYRATSPQDLKAAGYRVGPDNDIHIRAVLSSHVGPIRDNVICAWGANGSGLRRADEVLNMVRDVVRPKALAFTNDGTPSHPLMLPYSARPLFIDAGIAA